MEVLDERKAKGINDKMGDEASPINQEADKYQRGKKVLGEPKTFLVFIILLLSLLLLRLSKKEFSENSLFSR